MSHRSGWVGSFARLARTHAVVAAAAAVVGYGFWVSRLEWDAEMRLWRAVGDAAFVLLIVALAVGPLARLWPPARGLLRWRRPVGIWCGLFAVAHGFLTLNGWVRWEWLRFWGYEFIPQAARMVRLEPGFGLANLLGVVALLWAAVLTATSSDRAVRLLGGPAWKWLHSGAYVVFYLASLHATYFLFLHYLFSFHRPVPPPDWFRVPFLALVAAVPLLQFGAFLKTRARRTRPEEPEAAPGAGGPQPALHRGSPAAAAVVRRLQRPAPR